MNRKQFVILLAVVAVVCAWGLSRMRKESSSWSGGGTATGQKLMGDFAYNDVGQIFIKHGTNELTLAKKSDVWKVAQRGDYDANYADIRSLLLKLKDMKVVQTEAVGPSQLGRLELAMSGTNTPTTVEFRDASGKVMKTLLLGKKHMRSGGQRGGMEDMGGEGGFPDGRYVIVGTPSDKVAVVSDALENLAPNAEAWLNKDFFKVEKARSIATTFQNATNSWKLVREKEGADLTLADPKPGEQLDSAKASGVANPFSSPQFVDVAVGLTAEQAGLDKPTTVAIETLDGFAYTIKIGAKTNDNYFLTMSVAGNFPKERTPAKDEKLEDKTKLDKEFADKQKKLEEKLAEEKRFEPWTYTVASWIVDPVIKERAQFMVEKKDEKKEGEKKDEAVSPEPEKK
jgi:hypothetical protein